MLLEVSIRLFQFALGYFLLCLAKAFDIEAHIIGPKEANDMLGGLLETKDLKGALWLPGDGTVSPSDLTASYISGAKKNGVQVFQSKHRFVVLLIF